MSYFGFRPYVPVAERRRRAALEMQKLAKKGRVVAPVVIEGRRIARNFWGKAWCDNLERYSDYANRLPRGRAYVGNGSVVDLQIARGRVDALVSGSQIYTVKIDIAVAAPARWKAICKDCADSIGSLVELLQGKLSKNVMERVCREADGLFPAPSEIKMSCSCPDWADMCKHVAATLYGVGARLDQAPDLLFALRGVDRSELISTVGDGLPLTPGATASGRVLAEDDVAALFGIDMAAPVAPKTGEANAKAPPDGDRFGEAASAKRRRKMTAPSSAAQETQRPAAPDAARRRAPKSAALAAERPGKPPAKGRSATTARDPARTAKKTKETMTTAVAAPEASRAKPAAKSRPTDDAPVGRTRAAKWIGARARKARG